VGLTEPAETLEAMTSRAGVEMDLVTQELKKFLLLLLKPNGNVLEQLYSPLVVHTSPEHEELCLLGRGCVTRRHARHYLGMAESQWRLFQKEAQARVKPLLYVFRVLLTGIHLLRTGAVEANLRVLNAQARLSYLDDLIARKLAGPEGATLDSGGIARVEAEYLRLRLHRMLEEAETTSTLPDTPTPPAREAIERFLVRLRLTLTDMPRSAG
jgi:predicted nucleotidyltransferase